LPSIYKRIWKDFVQRSSIFQIKTPKRGRFGFETFHGAIDNEVALALKQSVKTFKIMKCNGDAPAD
jgi:hypothetical protein